MTKPDEPPLTIGRVRPIEPSTAGLEAGRGLDTFRAALDEDGDRPFGSPGTCTALSGVLRL